MLGIAITATLLATPAGAKTFRLPEKDALFSITFPDTWETQTAADAVTSSPANANVVVVAIFPLDKPKQFEEALQLAAARAKGVVEELRVESGTYDVEFGIRMYIADLTGKRNGAQVTGSVGAISPDAEHSSAFSSLRMKMRARHTRTIGPRSYIP